MQMGLQSCHLASAVNCVDICAFEAKAAVVNFRKDKIKSLQIIVPRCRRTNELCNETSKHRSALQGADTRQKKNNS